MAYCCRDFVVNRRKQQMFEQRYTNVTIMIKSIANIDCFEVGHFASHFELVAWLKLLNCEH